MKNRIMRLIAGWLVILPLTNIALATFAFPDVDEDAPYADAVEYLNEIGIMQGDENGNFNPDKAVTRAEMAIIVCRVLGETENLSASSAFSDVPVDHWANGYIGKAAELGIVNGLGNGMFGPSDTVTYEQTVAMIVRAIGGAEEAAGAGGYPDGFLAVAQINGFLFGLNIQKGTPLSRAYVALILFNYFNNNY